MAHCAAAFAAQCLSAAAAPLLSHRLDRRLPPPTRTPRTHSHMPSSFGSRCGRQDAGEGSFGLSASRCPWSKVMDGREQMRSSAVGAWPNSGKEVDIGLHQHRDCPPTLTLTVAAELERYSRSTSPSLSLSASTRSCKARFYPTSLPHEPDSDCHGWPSRRDARGTTSPRPFDAPGARGAL